MPLFHYRFEAMASRNDLQLWHDDAMVAGRVGALAIAEVHRIETKYSRYRDDSVTTAVNRAAGGDEIPIDAETAALLRYAEQCHRLSEGRFDITSGALRRLWDFRRSPPRIPLEAEIDAVVALIGWNRVEWNERMIRLPCAGMEIDFGGIGKEYAADRAATILQEQGVRHALINLGGDVRAVGTQRDGALWRVGIAHPRAEGTTIASIELDGNAVATSGDYERYFEFDRQRYCHLLNARTGWPVRYWQSVSVVAPLCVVAGSCSSIAMLLEGAGEAFLASQQVRYFAIGADGSVRGDAA